MATVQRLCFSLIQLAMACSLATGTVRAEVSISKTVEHYEIFGRTVQELRQSLNQNDHSLKITGTRAWATTEWWIDTTFLSSKALHGCTFKSVKTIVRIKHHFPHWVDMADAPLPVQSEWVKMMEALRRHEEQHGQHALEGGRELDAALQKMKRETCDALLSDGQKLYNTVVQKTKRRDVDFDKRTNHGGNEILF